ncbi:hypothetical protein ANCDUO_22730 [Ancylostoma duodenale]|uniref:Uncharacterized protein n=1 Tax=Ancylostoma duodenale TaxID=51022 RepID=A0A0C2FKC9_9BILA|nr:hypothetical protein ANCDUO_22730 [Ancylostoma duodenale]
MHVLKLKKAEHLIRYILDLQVAEDTDVGRYVQSGLWLYCPGAAQCWYIFSDNLINYYERGLKPKAMIKDEAQMQHCNTARLLRSSIEMVECKPRIDSE